MTFKSQGYFLVLALQYSVQRSFSTHRLTSPFASPCSVMTAGRSKSCVNPRRIFIEGDVADDDLLLFPINGPK